MSKTLLCFKLNDFCSWNVNSYHSQSKCSLPKCIFWLISRKFVPSSYGKSYCKYSALANTCSSISNDDISRTDELPLKYSLSITQEPLRSRVPFCRKQLVTLSRFQTEHSKKKKRMKNTWSKVWDLRYLYLQLKEIIEWLRSINKSFDYSNSHNMQTAYNNYQISYSSNSSHYRMWPTAEQNWTNWWSKILPMQQRHYNIYKQYMIP